MARDFYDILGISRTASESDIKQAYRKLSKELHPDKHKGDKTVETKFKEVNQAYEVLSNPEKRRMYDQFGAAGVNGAAGAGGGFSGQGFGGFDFSSFTGGSGPFADIFESFFGGTGHGGRDHRGGEERGSDREIELTIEFLEAVSGVERTLSIRKLRTCDVCKGKGAEPGSSVITCSECGGTGQVTRAQQSFFGQITQRFLCPRCHGSGKVPEKPCKNCAGEGRLSATESVTVSVPPGIHSEQTLRVRGGGDSGRQGATSGDLYVHIRVRPDPRFERDGDDIRTALTVALLTALLGGEENVETVQGVMTLKIPEGTQPGQVFRLKGKGMPVLSTSRHGDHYVTVSVEIPKKLGREERRLVEEWRKLL